MDDEQKLKLDLAIERELARDMVPRNRTPSISDNVNIQSILELYKEPTDPPKKVQSSVDLPRLPSSSARPRNWIARSWTKNGLSSSKPPNPTSVASACEDWIGRSQKPKSCPLPSIPTKDRSDLKRKASNELQFIPFQKLSPSPGSSSANKKPADDLFCKTCQVSCSSTLTLRQHLVGRPHKAKLEYVQLKAKGGPKGKSRCEMCQIWCSDCNALDLHFKGQKHKSKLEELKSCGKNGERAHIGKKPPILCELCLVPCMNEDLFALHLKGRSHSARQELKNRGML